MDWVIVLWSMIVASSLTLGIVHCMTWLRSRDAMSSFWFALVAFSIAAFAVAEYQIITAGTVDEFAHWQRWTHLPGFCILVSTVWFIYYYFGTARLWLAWLVTLWRVIVLAINFAGEGSINFVSVTALQPVELWGQTLQTAVAVTSPWNLMVALSGIAVALYVLDAAFRLWRHDGPNARQRVIVIAGPLAFSILYAVIYASMLHLNIITTPYFLSPVFMFLVAAMSYQLGFDLWESSRLAHQLQETRRQIDFAAGELGLRLWAWEQKTPKRFRTTEQGWQVTTAEGLETLSFTSLTTEIHPEDHDRVSGILAASQLNGSNFNVVYRTLTPDHEVRWASMRGRTDLDAGGRPVRIAAVIVDITEQKRLEDERTRAITQLAHLDRVSLLGQFTASLTHELNQPIGAILRNSEAAILLLDAESPDLKEIKNIMQDILRDNIRAGQVLSKLRSLLKSHSVELKPVSIETAITDVTSILHAEAIARRIRLEVDVQPGLPEVPGDIVHLQQVLLNLISNAMDSAGEYSMRPPHVLVVARLRSDGMVEVSVRDSGAGIVTEKSGRIFEPFYTSKESGLGIGLPICRTIIETHGGKIWFDADTNEGANFIFTLPCLSTEQRA